MNPSLADIPISIHGLSERDLDTLLHGFLRFPEINHVVIFGSRAMGNFKKGSDIDLAIINEGVSSKTLNQIASYFEDSSLPYRVDIVYLPELCLPELIDHIKRVGKLFYQVSNATTDSIPKP